MVLAVGWVGEVSKGVRVQGERARREGERERGREGTKEKRKEKKEKKKKASYFAFLSLLESQSRPS